MYRAAVLALFLASISAAEDPIPQIAEAGRWGAFIRYSVAVCNRSEAPIVVSGLSVWAYAQGHGIQPLTHAQVQEEVTRASKLSAAEIAQTVCLATSGVATGLEAVDAFGEQWSTLEKSIVPLAGAGCLVLKLARDRHEIPLEKPADYLPPQFDIKPGDCAVATLIGRRP